MFENIKIPIREIYEQFKLRAWNVMPWELPRHWRETKDNLLRNWIEQWIAENRESVVTEAVRTARQRWLARTRLTSTEGAHSYEVENISLELNLFDYMLCDRLRIESIPLTRSTSKSSEATWRVQLQDNEWQPVDNDELNINQPEPPETFIIRHSVNGNLTVMGESDLSRFANSMSRIVRGPTGIQGATGIPWGAPTGLQGATGMLLSLDTGMIGIGYDHGDGSEGTIQVLEKQESEKLKCETCQGKKVDENGAPCKVCRGTGKRNMKMKWVSED